MINMEDLNEASSKGANKGAKFTIEQPANMTKIMSKLNNKMVKQIISVAKKFKATNVKADLRSKQIDISGIPKAKINSIKKELTPILDGLTIIQMTVSGEPLLVIDFGKSASISYN